MKNSKSAVDDQGHRFRSGSLLTNYPHSAAHSPIQHDETTGMQQATLGKGSSKTASQLQGRTARAFSSNSLVKTMEITVIIQYILTATQSFGSQDYCKKSGMKILGLDGVLFYENE